MEDDGVWADDGDEMQQEAAARRESHYNAGYRQGLDEGQHHTIQQGFDAGTVYLLMQSCMVRHCPRL